MLHLSFGDGEKAFIEKVRKAHQAGSVDAFVELHYGGVPEVIRPMVERRWAHEIKKGPLSDLSIRPFESEDTAKRNKAIKLKGDSYIRTAPASAFIVFTYETQSASVPISLVGDTYYLSSFKKQ